MIFHKCSCCCCWCRHRKTGRDKRESYLFSIYFFFFFFFDFYHKSYSSSSLIVHSWQMNAAASWPFILFRCVFPDSFFFFFFLNFLFCFSFSSLFPSPLGCWAATCPAVSVVGAPFFSAIALVMIVTVTCFLAMDHHGRVTSASPLMGYQQRREREITTTKTEGLWHVIA